MKGYWAKGLQEEQNVTLAWVKTFTDKKAGTLRLACASCAQIFVDGKLVGFAPMRAAHGYARVTEFDLPPFQTLVILAAGYNINSFWLYLENSFCAAELEREGERTSIKEMPCYRVDDRLQKVQRYSYQRNFIEAYDLDDKRERLFKGEVVYSPVAVEEVEVPVLLPTTVHLPKLNGHTASLLREGTLSVDESMPVWRDRSYLAAGKELLGYTEEEWEAFPTHEASQFVFDVNGGGRYALNAFSSALTGFIAVSITAEEDCTVYLLFAEILKDGKNVSFGGADTANCIKYTLKKGKYNLLTFEPYTMQYVQLVSFGKAILHSVRLIDYENPDAEKFTFEVADEKINAILQAAVRTFKQNAVDVLMDCPSRERAGWLSDGYFSSVAERLFTGENLVEDAFLESYALCKPQNFPDGIVPMCYPADDYDGTFIPNWTMWYVLEVYKNWKTSGNRENVDAAKLHIYGLIEYFSKKENEYELLENLNGWVFVEWSAANDRDHVCGVNYPSNMCWAKCLDCIAEMYGEAQYAQKAKRMREKIIELSFDGEWFVDNSVRGEDGKLCSTGLKTEVCQYYAFWFGVATKEQFAPLYQELYENFGAFRKEGYRPDIAPCNALYGMYMRLDLFMRDGDINKLKEECVQYFYPMAERTGTLWAHNRPSSSCVHGFASYAAKWLVYALIGWDGEKFDDRHLGIDCSFTLPQKDGGKICVSVKEGQRKVERV